MKLHLTASAIAMATVALANQSTVSAVRSGSAHSAKAMDANGAAEAVVCTTGEQILHIKAANETASFKCGANLSLDPPFQPTAPQAYASANSTSPVAISTIVPDARFTETSPALNLTPAPQKPSEKTTADLTYHLNVPTIPPEDKNVVFKCVTKSANSGDPGASGTTKQTEQGAGTSTNPSCVMVINIAKSAASVAATPLAAAGSVALALLASAVSQGF
ncbi:sag-related sequence srs13 [Cystoisospora suis]|uniref:Sag-related sequence srs13 n=1 Tax=Cystoisospora suis TaxID=483139 RepID=A0A2C6L1E8_9APIC|nr:sag-related sequence srs13 [Cystoisospora suis]